MIICTLCKVEPKISFPKATKMPMLTCSRRESPARTIDTAQAFDMSIASPAKVAPVPMHFTSFGVAGSDAMP